MTSVFPRMPLTSIPIGRLQNQSNAALNFLHEKSLCDAVRRQFFDRLLLLIYPKMQWKKKTVGRDK